MKDARKYKEIKNLATKSGMSAHDAAAFYFAYEAACESTFGGFAIGCVIVSGGKILGAGTNTTKSDPIQKAGDIHGRRQ